jgi:hypothetical protein
MFLCWFSVWMTENGVLASPIIIVLQCISPFGFINIGFTYLGDLLLGRHACTIIISSCQIDPTLVFNLGGNLEPED